MFGSFLGGIHPRDGKELAKDKPIENMPVPKELIVPLGQHIGAPCAPTVKVGDEVKRGQLIGTSPAFMHADIHAPVSGKVVKIEPRPHSGMGSCMAVVIQNDGKDEWADGLPLTRNWQTMSSEEILAAIQSAGIVGMGGATFPAHILWEKSLSSHIHNKYLHNHTLRSFLSFFIISPVHMFNTPSLKFPQQSPNFEASLLEFWTFALSST